MKKPLNIISFLLIIFLGSSTSMGADFPPVKTGTMLVCKNNLPHIYLIEFINESKTKTYSPRRFKETKKGYYYYFRSTIEKYSGDYDSIVVKTKDVLSSWILTIDRSNLESVIKGKVKAYSVHNTPQLKCESVDKTTFDNEIEKLKKEIEEHNNLIDEYYKKTNKI